MADAIEKIFETLNRLERTFDERDPAGIEWELRTVAAYRIFRAMDAPRFRLEPADLDQVLAEVVELVEHVEGAPSPNCAAPAAAASERTPEEKSRRMQFLYGLAWAQLSQDEYYDAAALLGRRLRNSNLDTGFLVGADCLDLGTGIARWAVAMIQLGAASVLGIDFSRECLEEAERRLEGWSGADRIELRHGDIYKLPGELGERFDFVCANGVIHHLPDPAEALKVMARCTKPGGRGFVFVFSKNDTPWWPSVELMRKLLAPVPIDFAHRTLKFFEVPGAKIFNTLDYSYTPIQHKLDREWFEHALRDAGYRELTYLEGGVIHDSVLRARLFEPDRRLFGVSEVRYLLRK